MKRQTIYIGLLLFAAALSACAREHGKPTPAPGVKAIGFDVTDNVTRSVTTDASEILSLGIFGYSTGTEEFDPDEDYTPNLFANREATRASASDPWVYDPVAVWPSDDSYNNTFFAYSPYEDEFPSGSITVLTDESTQGGYPQIYYKVPESVSDQVDLLYSEYVTATNASGTPTAWSPYVSNINYNTNLGYVKYKMKHATIWIRFLISTVKETSESTESYSVTEFYMMGGNIMAGGVFDMGTATWKADPALAGTDDGYSSATYDFDFLEEGANAVVIPAGDVVPLSDPLTPVTADCLIMIPQNLETSKNLLSVAISYTHDDGSGSPSETEYYMTMPFPDVKLGAAGYVMTYIVEISTSGAWIEFHDDNTIEKWLEDNTDRETDVF